MPRNRQRRRSSKDWSERLETRLLLTSSELDPGYGIDGVAVSHIYTSSSSLTPSSNLSALLPDGTLVVANRGSLCHFLTDGSFDTEFGNGSESDSTLGLFSMPHTFDYYSTFYISSVTVDSAGDIYASWSSTDIVNRLVVSKISSDGNPISTFGTNNGWLFYSMASQNFAEIADIAITPDDSLLVLGITEDSKSQVNFFVKELLSDGSFSSVFNSSTIPATTVLDSYYDFWTGFPVSIVYDDVAEDFYIGCNNSGSPLIYKFHSDGSMDNKFGVNGLLQMPTTDRYITDMTVNPDSQLLIATCDGTQPSDSFFTNGYLYRLTTAGALDAAFGTAGVATPANGIDNTRISSVDILSDGSIITGIYGDFGAFHFSQNGVFDAAFDLPEVSSSYPSGSTYGAYSMPDGRILLGGVLTNINSSHFSASARIAGNGIVRPTIHFTLPASAGENESIPLTANIDALPNQPIISYQWDLDYNGSYFAADITGSLESIAPWTFNGPSSHVIALRVVDSTGLASHITTTTLQINNAAPVPAVELAYGAQTPFFINSPVPIDLSFVDAPSDYVTRWSVDWGDGITQLFVNKPASLFHAYAAAGTYGISVTTRDNDGATSDPVAMSVKIYHGPQIEGTVFLDNNANGLKNTADPGASGVVVWLDENNNGVLDDAEPNATTDSKGHYSLINLPVASASKFRIQTPQGYRNTTPKFFNAFSLPENQTQTMNFGFTNRVNLTGTIFLDENNNRRRDPVEHLLAKVRIYIDANNNGVFDFGEKSVLTNSKGVYRFNNIVAGRQHIRTVLPYALRKLHLGTPKSDLLVNLDVAKILTTKNFYFVD